MLEGAFVAMVTPFTEKGEIDLPGVARLLAYFEHHGLTGVVVAGTNGEGPSLSSTEKRDITQFAVRHSGKLKVIAGLATCSLTEARWLAKRASESGAMAGLVLPPFYFPPNFEGIEAWFRELATTVELPLILYNIPQNVGFSLPPPMVERLLRLPSIAGIKDSSGNPALLEEYLVSAHKSGKEVLVGDERLLLSALYQGASGTISGLANSTPHLIARQVRERSEVLQALIETACQNLKTHPQPAVHKYVLHLRGMPFWGMRPPLVPLSPEAQAQVASFLQEYALT